ncbi:MAG: DUF5723 family protein [Bacteroidales bacterium]
MKKIIFTLILLSALGTSHVYSQTNNTHYFMHNLPQAHTINPAQVPDYNFFIGGLIVPVVGQLPPPISLSINTPIDYNDLFHYGRWEYKDSIITPFHPNGDLDEFLDKLKKVNYTTTNLDLNLLYVGFKQGEKNFWSFGITDKMSSSFGIPKKLVTFSLLGNGVEQDATFSGLAMNMLYHREYAIGFQRDITRYFSLGGKIKLLTGLANIYTSPSSLTLHTEEETYIIHSSANYVVNTNAPLEVTLDDKGFVDNIDLIDFESSSNSDIVKDYLLFTGNNGVAIDVGFSKEWNSELSYFVNITDVGYITWNTHTHNFSMAGSDADGSGFEFNGAEITGDNTSQNISDIVSLDTIVDSFDFEYTQDSYTTWLPWKIYAGAQYKFTKSFNIGAVGKFQKLPDRIKPSVTATANFNLGKISHISLSYSMLNGNYNNLGFGYAFNIANFQWYLITDNLISSALFPYNTRSASFRMGCNFLLGYKDKTKRKKLPLFKPRRTPGNKSSNSTGLFGKKRKEKAVNAPDN